MEILKRAKHFQSGEGVSFTENPETVKEEAIRRGAKAGYCTKNGEPVCSTKIMARGCGESKLNIWPRDEKGNLQGD